MVEEKQIIYIKGINSSFLFFFFFAVDLIVYLHLMTIKDTDVIIFLF